MTSYIRQQAKQLVRDDLANGVIEKKDAIKVEEYYVKWLSDRRDRIIHATCCTDDNQE